MERHASRAWLVLAVALLGLGLGAPGGALAEGAAAPAGLAQGVDLAPAGQAGPEEPEVGAGGAIPPEALAHVPTVDDVAQPVVRAWHLRGSDLDERVLRAQQAGLTQGMRSLRGPARAVLLDPRFGSALERAEAAVRLAPDLPAAHAALARARLSEGRWIPAIRSASDALGRVPADLDAWLWLRAAGLHALFLAVFTGGFLYLAVVLGSGLPRLVRRLGGLHDSLPSASRLALVGSLVLLPAALGEGLYGTALVLAALALCQGGMLQRLCVTAALAGVLFSLYPLLDRSAEARAALAGHPMALAVWDAEHGLPDAAARARVERAAPSDPLAARALALREKREGRLAEAEARYRALLEQPGTPDLWNNAAGVLMARGEVDEAIELYEAAAKTEPSPVVLFNLSQAYGRAIRLDDQDVALSKAQAIDAEALADLAEQVGETAPGLVVDLPVHPGAVMPRLAEPASAQRFAQRLRAALAPGVAGRSLQHSATAAAGALLCGGLLGMALRRLREEDDLYTGIARLLQGGGGNSTERMQKLAELRARQARAERLQGLVSLLVPGAAGVLAKRPLLGVLAALCFTAAAALWWQRAGVAPDPLVLGDLPTVLFPTAVAALLSLYVLSTALAFLMREPG